MKLWWIDMRNVRLCSCTLYIMKVQAFIPACCIGWRLFAATHGHRRKLKYNVKMLTVMARIPITIFTTATKLDGAACAFEDNMIRLIPSSSMNLVILLKVSWKITLLKFQRIEKCADKTQLIRFHCFLFYLTALANLVNARLVELWLRAELARTNVMESCCY